MITLNYLIFYSLIVSNNSHLQLCMGTWLNFKQGHSQFYLKCCNSHAYVTLKLKPNKLFRWWIQAILPLCPGRYVVSHTSSNKRENNNSFNARKGVSEAGPIVLVTKLVSGQTVLALPTGCLLTNFVIRTIGPAPAKPPHASQLLQYFLQLPPQCGGVTELCWRAGILHPRDTTWLLSYKMENLEMRRV